MSTSSSGVGAAAGKPGGAQAHGLARRQSKTSAMILGGGPSGYAYERRSRVAGLARKCANFCGNLARSIEVNQFLVTRPDGPTKLQLKGTVNVVIVDHVAFNKPFCQDPWAVPTYTGTAELIPNDSDFFDLSGPEADAAKMHLVGTVTDESEAGAAEAEALANQNPTQSSPG